VDLGRDPQAQPPPQVQSPDLPLPPPAENPLLAPVAPDADDEAPAPPPPAVKPEAKLPPAPNPAERPKGEPGMMGLPWPKSPEEAGKTMESLYAFLATEADHRKAGEIGAAIERLWRLDGGDTVNLLIDRAEDFSSKMDQERALALMDAAVDLAPDYAEAWSHRAYVYYRMNNYAAALGDLRRAVALDPNHFRALDAMAKILELLGEKKAALKAYEQLLAIHPEIEGGREAYQALKKELDGQGI
jgi:tetratricopeptide (TPR) repeat protein